MDAEFKAGPPAAADSAQTLGDVLYGADFNPRIPETDWVAMIRAIAGGDTGAFGNLYMMTHGIVFTLIVRITGSRRVAEDLTIEVFHDVWRQARYYDPGAESVVGWMMNLARAHALARQRTTPQAVAAVREAVKQLSPEERLSVEATFHCGASSAQAASATRQSTEAVEAQIRSAMNKLARVLPDPDGTP